MYAKRLPDTKFLKKKHKIKYGTIYFKQQQKHRPNRLSHRYLHNS